VLQLGFSVQVTHPKQEATDQFPSTETMAKAYLSMRVNCYRHHSQLSKSCSPNVSYDQFNHSCLAEGKISPGVFILPHKAIKNWRQLSATKN